MVGAGNAPVKPLLTDARTNDQMCTAVNTFCSLVHRQVVMELLGARLSPRRQDKRPEDDQTQGCFCRVTGHLSSPGRLQACGSRETPGPCPAFTKSPAELLASGVRESLPYFPPRKEGIILHPVLSWTPALLPPMAPAL